MICLHRGCFQANAAPWHSHPSLPTSSGAVMEQILEDDEPPKRQVFSKQQVPCSHFGALAIGISSHTAYRH